MIDITVETIMHSLENNYIRSTKVTEEKEHGFDIFFGIDNEPNLVGIIFVPDAPFGVIPYKVFIFDKLKDELIKINVHTTKEFIGKLRDSLAKIIHNNFLN